MRDSLATPASGDARVALPVGELVELGETRVRVTLAVDARTRAQVLAVVERLQGIAAEYFWIPTTVDETADRLVLDYALEEQAALPFALAQPRWRDQLAVHLPELVGLGLYLQTCARVLAETAIPAPIAPAYLRYLPARGRRQFGPWRLLVVPHVDVGVAEWARAAPETWAWVPGGALLGSGEANARALCGAPTLGAALYAAIVGDVFPATLPVRERFARALRGHVAIDRGALLGAIRDALPTSFAGEAEALAAVIGELLDADPRADVGAWRDRFAELGSGLGPYRTAVRWEYEGKLATARGILERLAASAPDDAVPWDVLARLRRRDGDHARALDATIAALATEDPHAVRDLAALARAIAQTPGDAATQRAMIERAVAAVDQLGARVGDAGRLHFAHVEARYLQRYDAARARLAAPMQDGWDNILRATILARLHAQASEWAHVARLCKEARLATRAMSMGGGQLGAYAVAYLDHLDGVAHFGAIGTYNDPLYMADAFQRFVSSLDAAKGVVAPDDPLIDANVAWLGWLGAMAVQMQVPDAIAIRTGVTAYLAAQGLAARDQVRREVPPLVWYDAGRLLALSNVSGER